MEAVIILVNAGTACDTVNRTRPVFCTGRIANAPFVKLAEAFRSARIRHDFTYHFGMPSSGHELKVVVHKTNARHWQLRGDRTSRLILLSGNCRRFFILVSGRALLSHLDVTARSGYFSACILSVPTSHNARGHRLADGLILHLGSGCVGFIRACASMTTARRACVSDATSGQVSADHLAYCVPELYPQNNSPHCGPPTSMLLMTALSAITSTVLNPTPTTFFLDRISSAAS